MRSDRAPTGERDETRRRDSAPIVLLIGLGKLLKAAFFITLGIGALDLLHRDVTERFTEWAHALRADPDDKYIHWLLERVVDLTPAQLERLSVGTFAYAALFLVEGVGLVLRKRWAEWLTVLSTALLLPLELYALMQKFTLPKIAILALNIAIVWYLLVRLRSKLRRAGA